jgi:hypothetical protein
MEPIPCETCGTLTYSHRTKRCEVCWETERALYAYLSERGPKAYKFVRDTLDRWEEEQGMSRYPNGT